MKTVASPKLALLASLALVGLFATPQQAAAGTTELKAIAKQLNGNVQPPGTTADQIAFIQSKTGSQVASAVIALIQQKPTAAAAYTGEALKQSNDADFGTTLGQALNANAMMLPAIFNAFPGDATKTAAAKAKFIGTASKLAATGTGAFAEWIEGFSRQLTASNAEAYAAAKIAIASKTAAGRIVGSRTLDPSIDTDAELIDLALKAILPTSTKADKSGSGLSAAAQEIAMFVSQSASLTDPATFAHDVIGVTVTTGTKSAQPMLAKLQLIATGTVAGNPDQAATIVNSLFNGQNGNLTGVTADAFFAATVRSAAKIATSVALVADAEQVEAVGEVLGAHIGQIITNPTTGKKKVAGIATTQINAIAKGLVLGLTNRTILPTYTTPALSAQEILNRQLLGANTASEIARLQLTNSRTNRLDEIGEIGAYLLNSIKGLGVFNGKDTLGNDITLNTKAMAAAKKQAVALVSGLIKTIITSSAKIHRDIASVAEIGKQRGTLVVAPIFQATAAEDVAGSIALTLNSLGAGMNQDIFAAIKLALTTDTKIGSKLAGASKTQFTIDGNTGTIAQLVQAALAKGFSATPGNIYEDGTVAAYAMGPFGGVSEPETDIRIH